VSSFLENLLGLTMPIVPDEGSQTAPDQSYSSLEAIQFLLGSQSIQEIWK
jgi:hypothetical protein